jgi:hypothetical protein
VLKVLRLGGMGEILPAGVAYAVGAAAAKAERQVRLGEGDIRASRPASDDGDFAPLLETSLTGQGCHELRMLPGGAGRAGQGSW